MPRDSNGNYTLPAGNPVTTLSVISSTWANTTMSDLSTALTGSLDRSGQGAMLAGLKLFDGAIGAPGLTWGTETTAGIYRAAAGDFRFAVSGVDVFRFFTGGAFGLFNNGSVGNPAITWVAETNSGFYRNAAADFRWSLAGADLIQWTTNLEVLSGTAPARRWNETDAAANNRLWDIVVTGEQMAFRVLSDALGTANWLTVDRTAQNIDTVALSATAFTVSTASTTFTRTANVTVRFEESAAAANNRLWVMGAFSEAFAIGVSSDAGVVVNWLEVARTANTVDSVTFTTNLLMYGTQEVGYRNLPQAATAGGYTFVASDRGFAIIYVGPGGNQFSINNGVFSGGEVITIFNSGAGNLIISGTIGTLNWFNGSGTISSGGRNLAVGGVATVVLRSNVEAWIYGTGIS